MNLYAVLSSQLERKGTGLTDDGLDKVADIDCTKEELKSSFKGA